MKEFFNTIFSADRFMPHGHCYFWEPGILWSYAIANTIIALAYLSIPITLVYIFRRRDDFKFIWMMILFAIFILGCGVTHVFDVINIWKPLYYLDSGTRIITALASIGTAVVLVKVTPDILKIPSAKQWIKINEELQERQQKLEDAYHELKAGEEELQEKNLELTTMNEKLQKSYDEIEIQQRELKATNLELEKAKEDLKKLNEDLEERVQERTQALEQKNTELSLINNDLDTFIYSASHDLKAPAVNMEGILYALKPSFKKKLEKKERELFGMLEISIGKLKTTIDYLTDVSKINKKIEEDQEMISIKEVIEDVKSDLRPLIDETQPTITESIEVSKLHFSKSNFKSIVLNLVSNALKYRSPERNLEINLRTYQEDGHIILTVEDNGLGIRKDQQDKIFILFKRLHNHVEGTGVGLYIVKKLLDNSGNQISVDSEPNEGSKFGVFFKQENIEI